MTNFPISKANLMRRSIVHAPLAQPGAGCGARARHPLTSLARRQSIRSKPPMNIHHLRCAVALLLPVALALPASAQTSQAPTPQTAVPALDPQAQTAFRAVADEFIAAARNGDVARMAGMISPEMVAKTGQQEVERYLADPVVPFFAQFKELGRSETIAPTAEVAGFVFYLYMVSNSGEHRPFVLYVIEEKGAKVVANVLVDHFVATRHCKLEAGSWKCPDFQ
jgi:hypothetical protein